MSTNYVVSVFFVDSVTRVKYKIREHSNWWYQVWEEVTTSMLRSSCLSLVQLITNLTHS